MTKKTELIKLQKEWYNKLEKEGFVDIEVFNQKTMEPHMVLKNNGTRFGSIGLFKFDAKQEYYLKAFHHLNNFDFDPAEKAVWSLHTQGESHRKIKIQIPSVSMGFIIRTIHKHRDMILPDLKSHKRT